MIPTRARIFATIAAVGVAIACGFAPGQAFAQAARQAALYDAAADQWAQALRKASTPFEFQTVAEEALIKMDGAARAERFEAAEKLGLTAVTAASKSQNASLRQEAAARKKELDEVGAAWQAARAKRTGKPDAEGYLVLGKYLCFVRADWEAGLGKLMMCSDDTLKDLAWKTSLVKDDVAEQTKLGDLWWEESTKTSGKPKAEYQAGAAYLYARAFPELKPPESLQIRKRLDEAARSAGKARVFPGLLEVTLRDDLGLRLRRIPAGKIVMGSLPNEPGRQPEEIRQPVNIPRPFYCGVTEVTQAQWGAVLNRGNPSRVTGDPNLPVENFSWAQAQQFCDALNARPIGRQYRFRLPTAGEWEYACRAGTPTPFFYGNDPALLGQFAWYKDNTTAAPKPVAGLRPNAWGLYDMLGNLEEWTATTFDEKLYPSPQGSDRYTPGHIMVRGGHFNFPSSRCRSAALRFHPAATSSNQIGLRVVCDIVTGEAPPATKGK